MSNDLISSSNADYHANTTHLSSSGLKLLLKSPEEFYNRYIAKTVPTESKAVFDEGSFVHALLLEPDTILSQYAMFQGLRKSGADYQQFVAENPNKTVLSLPQVLRCEKLAKAALSVPLVEEMLGPCLKEHTMLSAILNVAVKSRADAINVPNSYIIDIKTTSMPTDVDMFRNTVAEYAYDLSAALYCQIAHDNYGKLFDFYFIVLSKADNGVGVYRCSSATLSQGAAKVTSALVKYKQCVASGDWSNAQHGPAFANTSIEILEV